MTNISKLIIALCEDKQDGITYRSMYGRVVQKMGVAQSRSRRGPRVSGPKINEVFSYGLYSTNPIPS